MKTVNWQTISSSQDETEKIAERIGMNLRGGEVIELLSDLGGGKTTFVRGLARGLGSIDQVSSPTFKISNEYQGKDLRIYHFDFYRLPEPGVITHELAEVLGDRNYVVVIEWADIVQDVLPAERLTVVFSPTGENERRMKFNYPESLAYLIEGPA